jgi:hypothetical protein
MAWYTHLSDFLLSIGFLASKVDISLFILYDGTNIFYLLVYIDDILLTGSNSAMLHRLVQLLSSEFKLRDLGDVHYFLGIEVQSTGMGLMLRQHKYILDILTRAGMTSYKPVDTLFSPSKLAIQPDHPFSDPTRFRQIVGALQYLTFTRPDICFVVNRVCQYMHAPTPIWLLLNAYSTTSMDRHPMVFISLEVPFLLFMVLQMSIGLGVLMIAILWVAILFFFVRHRFHRNPASNVQLPAPPLRLSIKP